MPMPTLNDAIILAASKHEGQLDRAGLPYILHPLRLMLEQTTEVRRMAAVLHDVVEDTDVTLDDLREMGYSEEVVTAVDALTRRDGEAWEDYIERVASVPDAVVIKRADLTHNMDLRRLPEVKDSDLDRFRRYVYAWRRLGE